MYFKNVNDFKIQNLYVTYSTGCTVPISRWVDLAGLPPIHVDCLSFLILDGHFLQTKNDTHAECLSILLYSKNIVFVTLLSSVYRIMSVIYDAIVGPDLIIKYILSYLILSYQHDKYYSTPDTTSRCEETGVEPMGWQSYGNASGIRSIVPSHLNPPLSLSSLLMSWMTEEKVCWGYDKHSIIAVYKPL